MINVYKKVIEAATATVVSREASSPLNINVKEMPIEGLAKVRHVGAWAVKQVVFLSGETRKQDLPQSYTTAAHLRIGTCMSFFCCAFPTAA